MSIYPDDQPSPKSIGHKTKRHSGMSWFGVAASVILMAISLVVLYRISTEVNIADVKTAFAKAGQEQIGLAILFTVISYLFLTGYDALALRQLGIRVKVWVMALASFASYAISFTLGFPLLTAGTVRYWIYSSSGVSSSKVASLTLIAGSTFILGMALVIAVGLVWQPTTLANINQAAVSVNRAIGIAILAGLGIYLAWAAMKRRQFSIGRFVIEMPTISVSVGQLVLGAADVCAAAAVLYVLLPSEHGIAFETFAAVYAFACLLGIVSHAPGGLGVFEATILLAFHSVPKEGLIGALFLFRLCYYLGPFILALAGLGAYEIVMRMSRFRVGTITRGRDSE